MKKGSKKKYVVAWHYKIKRYMIFIIDYENNLLRCADYSRKIPKRLNRLKNDNSKSNNNV